MGQCQALLTPLASPSSVQPLPASGGSAKGLRSGGGAGGGGAVGRHAASAEPARLQQGAVRVQRIWGGVGELGEQCTMYERYECGSAPADLTNAIEYRYSVPQ